MEQPPLTSASGVRTVRKTYQEKLRPTPAQEPALDEVLWRCRVLYNTALTPLWSNASPGGVAGTA